MIESLSIRNFKALREVDVALKPLTVIVGPNSSGKSSILQALSLLTEAVAGSYISTHEILSRSPIGNLVLSCSGRSKRLPFSFRFEASVAEPFNFKGKFPFRPTRILSLDPKKLAEPSPLSGEALILPSDGKGLASVLAGFSLEHPSRFQRVIQLLGEIVPTVQNVRLRRKTIEKGITGIEVLFDLKGGEGFSADNVSEGTLLALGILTALSATDSPHLILIDDLERGLHPRALKDLVQALRSLQESEPTLQIVATSHSPYLLDFLKAEEVLLTSLDDEGYSIIGSLIDHPEYERWKGLMTSGEFWSSVGEDWLAKEKKATA